MKCGVLNEMEKKKSSNPLITACNANITDHTVNGSTLVIHILTGLVKAI